jgi:hypothetical protein
MPPYINLARAYIIPEEIKRKHITDSKINGLAYLVLASKIEALSDLFNKI